MKPDPRDTEAAYFDDLDRFVDLCGRLTAAGQAYLAVVLCHELYRFLYPVEPYADFKQTDPVTFLGAHIRRLIALGCVSLESVHGYESPELKWAERQTSITSQESRPDELEKTTSDLYSDLWLGYDERTMTEESRRLVTRRLPQDVVDEHISGRTVLDLGCGSGRYSIALGTLGAKKVTAVDYQAKSYRRAETYCAEHGLPVSFREADVLELPFDDRSFDFVFCNGVLHHTRSWQAALDEYFRVMRRSGFLYLYATGGFFWTTRRALRRVFKSIPRAYTAAVLDVIGMPAHRMIFLDTWYVPIELHISQMELESEFERRHVNYTKLTSEVEFDLDAAIARGIPGAPIVWGEGEHRYLLQRLPTAN